MATNPRALIARASGAGFSLGVLLAFAAAYLPDALSGNPPGESMDALLVFGLVLAPLGAGIGALGATVRTAKASPTPTLRIVTACTAFAILLVILGATWTHFTTGP